MKYTIEKKGGYYVADQNNNRVLFDTREEADEVNKKNGFNASVHGYMDQEKMRKIDGYSAMKLVDSGEAVYTKIFGLDWSIVEKGKFSFDDFTKGYFTFYIEK